jgi:hypothetical protein
MISNTHNYLNLTVILITVFTALLRVNRHEESPKTRSPIATYSINNLLNLDESQDARLAAVITLLKSHDLYAEITLFDMTLDARKIISLYDKISDSGIPADTFRVLGQVGLKQSIRIKVFKS